MAWQNAVEPRGAARGFRPSHERHNAPPPHLACRSLIARWTIRKDGKEGGKMGE